MRSFFVYWFLRLIVVVSRTFYTHHVAWVGEIPERRWLDYRLVAILNHTSLYEFLFAGVVPPSFLRRMAKHGVLPIASKTMDRPLVGRFWRFVAGNVVAISRERDHTWEKVLASIASDSMILILPEGRMKRATGLDSNGQPLTVRGGIADIIQTLPDGKMLIAYSLGLHHVQVPGQLFPKLFQPVCMRLEQVDIADYRAELLSRCEKPKELRKMLIEDLTRRRDRYCALPFEAEGAVFDD